jgi:hypothetical protein
MSASTTSTPQQGPVLLPGWAVALGWRSRWRGGWVGGVLPLHHDAVLLRVVRVA